MSMVSVAVLALTLAPNSNADGACSDRAVWSALRSGNAEADLCDDAVAHLARHASITACTRACTPNGKEPDLAASSLPAAAAELAQRMESRPELCHQKARLQLARRYACLDVEANDGRADAACVPNYAQAWQCLAPLRCVQVRGVAPDSCRNEQGQFEAIRLGLVLLAALLPKVEVTVEGAAGDVEVIVVDGQGTSWLLERIAASPIERQRFQGALVPGRYGLRVSNVTTRAAVAARDVAVDRGLCAWSVDARSSLVIGAQPRSIELPPENGAFPVEGPRGAVGEPESRSWILPGIWLGSVAGLTAWSLYAHSRASSLTSELDECAGDIASCRFAERRREIQRWDNVHENTAYAALILGGTGLMLGGVVWLIEKRAAQLGGGQTNVAVGLNHVSVTVQY